MSKNRTAAQKRARHKALQDLFQLTEDLGLYQLERDMMTTRHEFAHQVITKAKLKPNVQNFTLFLVWFEAEGTKARFNPLGCVQHMPGSTQFNTKDVQNYSSLVSGVDATVKTLQNGKYPDVLKRLQDGEDAIFTMAAIEQSIWGTHFDQPTSFLKNIRADWAKYAFKMVAE